MDIYLWSRTWPGPGWQLVAMRKRAEWINWLWCMERLPLGRG